MWQKTGLHRGLAPMQTCFLHLFSPSHREGGTKGGWARGYELPGVHLGLQALVFRGGNVAPQLLYAFHDHRVGRE